MFSNHDASRVAQAIVVFLHIATQFVAEKTVDQKAKNYHSNADEIAQRLDRNRR